MHPDHHPRSLIGRRRALSLAAALALSGCWGSFGATKGLWHWNDGLGSKWVKWLVFFGLSIIPVYELFVLGDALVLNSVEFWTGSNPVKSAANGSSVTRVATSDPNVLKLEVRRAGRLVYVAFCRRLPDGRLEILNAEGQPLTSVSEPSDGSLELRAGNHALLAQLDPAAVTRVCAQVAQGRPVHSLLELELGERAWRVARLGGELGASQLF
jgi:Domain of unknown function (DUF3332)